MNSQFFRIIKFSVFVAICCTGGQFRPAFASREPMSPLNPKTYSAPSGRFSLYVDPCDRQGRGQGTYVMYKDGKKIWRKQLFFTMYDAQVLDDGTTVGYAYTLGPEACGGKSDDDYGELVIAVIDADGNLRLNSGIKRYYAMRSTLEELPHPMVNRFFTDLKNDRFVVLTEDLDADRFHTTWRQYQLSSGKLLGEFYPEDKLDDAEQLHWCHMPQPIPDTPLTLVQWYRSSSILDFEKTDKAILDMQGDPIGGNIEGTHFAIIDMQGNPIWQKSLPDDYTVPGNQEAEKLLEKWWAGTSAILSVSSKGRFELAFAKDKQQVSFKVQLDETGKWKVVETSRKDWKVPEISHEEETAEETAEAERLKNITQGMLEYLGAVKLLDGNSTDQAQEKESPLENCDLSTCVFDDKGRLATVRWQDKKPVHFVRIDRNGNEAGRVLLPSTIAESPGCVYAWIGSDKYVLIVSEDYPVGKKSKAWIVDFSQNKLTPLPDFSCPPIKSIAGLPDGRFFVLAAEYLEYTIASKLRAYDASGKLQWTIDEGQSNDKETLFSPEDICITSDGLIAVVECIGDKVKLFDLSGKFVRLIDLDQTWGRDADYPADIYSLPNGELLVADAVASGGNYVRMTSEGKIVKQFRLSLYTGQDLSAPLVVDTNGRFWAPYGDSILELDENGVAKDAIGDPPKADRLNELYEATMDREGRLFIPDTFTYCLHVFSPEGKRLFVCKPDAKDASADSVTIPNITIAHTGEILLSLPEDGDGYIRFSPEGKRLGIAKLGLDSVTEEWHCLPGIDRRWIKCYEEIHLVDSHEKVLKTIKRRPDNNWFQTLGSLAVGPDGSFVVMDTTVGYFGDSPSFNLFSAEGEPIRTFPAPLKWLSPMVFNGSLIAAGSYTGPVFIFDTSGKALMQCNLEKYLSPQSAHFPFFSSDGKELQVLDAETRTLHRFALPKSK